MAERFINIDRDTPMLLPVDPFDKLRALNFPVPRSREENWWSRSGSSVVLIINELGKSVVVWWVDFPKI